MNICGSDEVNFIEAVKLSNESNGAYMRRKCWADGIAMYVHDPKENKKYPGRYANESIFMPYIATCHTATCELPGVRLLSDVLADDWETY